MKDPFPTELFDWRQRPTWVSRYLSLSLILNKIQNIRELSITVTSFGLDCLYGYSRDPDWKVRLEVAKVLHRFFHQADPKHRAQVMSVLKNLDLDPNPMIEIWVSQLHRDLATKEGQLWLTQKG